MVIFDGTTRVDEVFAIVFRWYGVAWVSRDRWTKRGVLGKVLA
jgi:hypothetical protein